MSFLWRWFLDVASRWFRFLHRPLRLPGPTQKQWFNDDILAEICARPEIQFQNLIQISMVSRRFRVLLMPKLFSKHTWSPWGPHHRLAFPPCQLWPYIRVLVIFGPYEERHFFDGDHRDFVISRLEPAIRGMDAIHTFVLSSIPGGVWPELLEAITAAPACVNLVLDDSPWLGKGQDIFDLPPTMAIAPLRRLSYISPYVLAPSEFPHILERIPRPPPQLESEVNNISSILRGCHSTLEALTLPGELVVRSLAPSLGWTSLRELFIQGFWPDPAGASLLSVLLAIPTLRISSFRCHPVPSVYPYLTAPSIPYLIVPRNILPSSIADRFPPHLQELEIASLAPGDRIFSVLPSGLEKLAVIEYPPPPNVYRHPLNLLRASQFLDALHGVSLPMVTHLEIWYMTDIADEQFLRILPSVFPSLEYLEVHRFVHPDMDGVWNPAPVLQQVLAQMKHLRVFALEPDPPERRDRLHPRGIDRKYARFIRRLKAVAAEIVQLAPWLKTIQIYVPIDTEYFWKRWEVVAGPDETVFLRPVFSTRLDWPGVHEIMEDGPVEPPESDSSDSDN
ncbi:hypothetical protein B0H12DRAFT_1331021 [Mycena haematopus]|nr:hypothetical protein B0H12DRAFT_1331021 [Mycena haematopus]